jgi:hypothetical protein
MPSLKNKNENHCGVVVSLTISSVPAMSTTLQKGKNGKTKEFHQGAENRKQERSE